MRYASGVNRNQNKTKPIKIQPTEQHIAYFDQLIKKGVYGGNWAEVVMSLVNDQLKQLRKDDELKDPE